MALPTKMPNLTERAKVNLSMKSPKPAITFLDLPPEILHMITALLDEEQLPVLRLVSKQACSCLSDIFAKVHFAHLRHHLTEPSLHDLVQITSHAMFSTYVKSIEFSTARTKEPSPESSDPLLGEDSEFRRAGNHVTMLVTVLENLSQHGNRKVSLGIFDSFYYHMVDGAPTIYNIETRSTLLGHGYIKSYGVENVLTSANPRGTMFAISQAAKVTGYSLQRLSLTTVAHPQTQTDLMILITDDQANAFLIEGSNQFKSNLMLRYVVVDMFESDPRYIEAPRLTVEIQTGASSHLSLQGQTIALDEWVFGRAVCTGSCLNDLPSVFFDNRYQTVTLEDLHLKSQDLTSLCSKTMQRTVECLEISNMDVWVCEDLNDLGRTTFLNHFKRRSNIKNFRISNLTVNTNYYVIHSGDRKLPQPLILAAGEIVAEGHDQVQNVFDDLIAQILTWCAAIDRDQFVR
ncbi:hypothetical protein KCU78_g4658, partial [Aureobasidium melanogenum]